MIRSKKVVRKKKGGKSKKEKAQKAKQENNEETWDNISGTISALLQGQDEVSNEVSPFDAASDIPIDEQKATALFRIQDLLKANKCDQAVGLLRYVNVKTFKENCVGNLFPSLL